MFCYSSELNNFSKFLYCIFSYQPVIFPSGLPAPSSAVDVKSVSVAVDLFATDKHLASVALQTMNAIASFK
jgi:hypothetical protein